MPPPPAELFASRVLLGPALRAQPDRRLVDLVRDGYDAAFEEIVRRYRRPLDRFAAAIVGGGSEDVTQDAFSKALLALRGSEAEIELRPWLYRIVRNTALNDLRDRPPDAAELSNAMPGGRSAAGEAEAREEIRDLMDRLGALPEPQRAALVMRELEGLSHEEIAAALGVSGGAARQAIHRARTALREGFGLLLPLPVLRALAEHGEGIAAGGLGAGALKAGMATVLIAGTVGAGVAIEHHQGRATSPETAEAAPLASGRHPGATVTARASAQPGSFAGGNDSRGQGGRSGDDSSGNRSGSSATKPSGDGSHTSGSDHSGTGSGGPGPSSNTGSSGSSGSGDRHGGSSGSDDGGSSGSGSGSSGDGGGSSGGSGIGDGLVSGGEGSGSEGGELQSEPIPSEETTLRDGSGSGSGSDSGSSDGGETSEGTSGSGDLSGTDSTSGSDGSP